MSRDLRVVSSRVSGTLIGCSGYYLTIKYCDDILFFPLMCGVFALVRLYVGGLKGMGYGVTCFVELKMYVC